MLRLAAVLIGLLAAGPVLAGPIADAGAEAERQLGQGKSLEALETLGRARDQVWKAMPLQFTRLFFVGGEPQGFGVFEPRSGNVFRAGEAMMVYGEPVGFGYGRDGDAQRIEFDVAMSVANMSGEVIIKPQSGKLALKTRRENKEFMVSFSYTPKDLQKGDYVLVAEFKDPNSGKSTVGRLPFRLQ